MPAPATPVRLYDIYAPRKDGVYGSVEGEAAQDIQDFIANDGYTERVGLIAPAGSTTTRSFDYVDPTDAVVEFALGVIDGQRVFNPSSGGTFKLTYNGSSTGLTTLAWDIAAATLQTALNANAAFTAGGNTGTVTKLATGLYRIAFDQVGVRFLLVGDGANLTPGSTITASRLVTGSVSVKEVQLLRVLQNPLAYLAMSGNSFPVAAASVTQLQTGTSLLPSIQRVTLDPEPYDGAFIVTFGKAEVVRVQAKANSGGFAEVSKVITVADTAGSLGGLYFDLYDNVGPVRVWIDVANGSTAPSTPDGGRLLEVNISANDSAGTVATAVQTAVDADAKFVATVSTATVTITSSTTGTRIDISAATSTFSAFVSTQGVNSLLDDKYFVLYDAANTSVAVWLTIDSADPPAGVLAQARYLTVAIGATDSANTIGGLIATAVDADADFTASNASGIVTITNAVIGTRTAASAGTSTFGVSVTGAGLSMSPTIAWNADDLSIQESIDPDKLGILITKSGPFSWDFRFIENGSRSALVADVTGLDVPLGLEGTMNLATDQMVAAMAAANFAPFQALYEGQVTFAGQLPRTFYRQTVTIYPDLIDASTTGPTTTIGGPTYLVDTVTGDIYQLTVTSGVLGITLVP